jgi:hypothetical protein
MLTRDVGPRLRELLEAGDAAPSWEEVLRVYAELQVDLWTSRTKRSRSARPTIVPSG